MKLKKTNLELIGFRKSGNHESVKKLFYKSLSDGLEIEVNTETGDGTLSIFNPKKDLTVASLSLQFANVEEVKIFIEAFNKVQFFN